MNRWTHEQDTALKHLAREMSSWQAVADAMQALRPGLGADAARVRGVRLGVDLAVRERWTAKQDDELRRLVEAGVKPWGEVAKRMQRYRSSATVAGVINRARNLGLRDTERPWTEEQRHELARLVEAGLRVPDMLAAMLAIRPGVTAAALRGQMQSMGLESVAGRGARRKACYHTIGRMADAGATPKEVAAATGLHPCHARRVMRAVTSAIS